MLIAGVFSLSVLKGAYSVTAVRTCIISCVDKDVGFHDVHNLSYTHKIKVS